MWKIEKIGILLVKRTPSPTPHLPFPNILDLSAHLHYILDLSRMLKEPHSIYPRFQDRSKSYPLIRTRHQRNAPSVRKAVSPLIFPHLFWKLFKTQKHY